MSTYIMHNERTKTMRWLFVYAHMDDETILSYGTMRKLADEGNEVYAACICGNGRDGFKTESDVQRAEAYLEIGKRTRACRFVSFQHSDLELDDCVVKTELQKAIDIFNPDVLVTHSGKDLHSEHRLVFEEALLLCRQSSNTNIKTMLVTASPTVMQARGAYSGSFCPNVFFDISKYALDKLEALQLYKDELPMLHNDYRSPQAVLDWNKMHGTSCNADYCEPYELVFTVR